jgi:hypothetical protein
VKWWPQPIALSPFCFLATAFRQDTGMQRRPSGTNPCKQWSGRRS